MKFLALTAYNKRQNFLQFVISDSGSYYANKIDMYNNARLFGKESPQDARCIYGI